jgi:hypothetical protein
VEGTARITKGHDKMLTLLGIVLTGNEIIPKLTVVEAESEGNRLFILALQIGV